MTWLDGLTFGTVIVHTVNGGPTYKGLKEFVHDDGVQLKDAALVEPEGLVVLNEPIFILREQIHALQPVNGA